VTLDPEAIIRGAGLAGGLRTGETVWRFQDSKSSSGRCWKRLDEARDYIAGRLKLTETDLAELLPSGRQTRFANRVAWTKVHLTKAGLLSSPERAVFEITHRGRAVLSEAPLQLDLAYLRRFAEFRDFRACNAEEPETRVEKETLAEAIDTPQEQLEQAYEQLRSALATDLLERIKAAKPSFFENLVVQLLLRMGYGGPAADGGRTTPDGADEGIDGIDGIINEDRLGLDVIYLQAKRWEHQVGRPELQRFVGALHGQRARKGIFITTSGFTREASEYVRRIDPKVVLIDGETLVGLMIDFNLGVAIETSYEIKRVDSDFFAVE
jgi:restriction system protein